MTAKEKATQFHEKGYNCAQSVLMSLKDFSGMDDRTAASIAGGFGGGAGCRELCGALSGAFMAVGLKIGEDDRQRIMAIDREITAAFREKFGAVRCTDLKAAKVPCDAVIAFAAEKAEELLK